MSDGMAEFSNPESWPGLAVQMKRLQRMTNVLLKIIEIDDDQTVISQLARNVLEGKDS